MLNSLFRSIKNTIICIDDLERKASNLHLDELLGFIDYLVRESQSKIILIYDEERLSENEDSRKYLDNYRERIIDIEVLLEPTIEENVNLVFKNDPDITIIQETSKNTCTTNIRILQKVQWVLNQLRPLMENWHHSLRSQLIINTIVFALSKFDSKFPVKFKEIAFDSDFSLYLNKSQEDLNKAMENYTFLSRFRYSRLELNPQIVKLIETSLFDIEEFVSQGNFLNKKAEEKNILEKFEELWTPYSNSFRRNELDIAKNIDQFLHDHTLDLPIQEFEKLENLALAVELDISSYKEALLEKTILTTENIEFLRSLKSRVSTFPSLMSSLEKKIHEWEAQQNITSVLREISKKNGWSQEEAEFLNSRTIDDYYQWLQEETPDLYILVRSWLDINIDGSRNLKDAIIKLAGESKLNAMRATFLYNITANKEVQGG